MHDRYRGLWQPVPDRAAPPGRPVRARRRVHPDVRPGPDPDPEPAPEAGRPVRARALLRAPPSRLCSKIHGDSQGHPPNWGVSGTVIHEALAERQWGTLQCAGWRRRPSSTTTTYIQLSPNATGETVERVYRLLAKRYHPDNQESGDASRFSEVYEAFNVLSDPERRAQYDVQYDQQRGQIWKIFDQHSATDGRDEDRRLFHGILSLLYVARRRDPNRGGLGVVNLERLLGVPQQHLDFPLWYLKKRGWLEGTRQRAARHYGGRRRQSFEPGSGAACRPPAAIVFDRGRRRRNQSARHQPASRGDPRAGLARGGAGRFRSVGQVRSALARGRCAAAPCGVAFVLLARARALLRPPRFTLARPPVDCVVGREVAQLHLGHREHLRVLDTLIHEGIRNRLHCGDARRERADRVGPELDPCLCFVELALAIELEGFRTGTGREDLGRGNSNTGTYRLRLVRCRVHRVPVDAHGARVERVVAVAQAAIDEGRGARRARGARDGDDDGELLAGDEVAEVNLHAVRTAANLQVVQRRNRDALAARDLDARVV